MDKGKTIGGFNPQHLSESRGFDGKKAIQRRTIDFNSNIMRHLQLRQVNKYGDYIASQPESSFVVNYLPPLAYETNPIASITTKFIHQSTNKWTPEGRRLITAASSGEFTLWNGLTFNFETILQAHDSAIRSMKWSHNDTWMLSGDDSGIIKYWQSNMNNLKIVNAHKETVRDLSFSPNDSKFASCSDDGTIKIWSFNDAEEERVLTGHGWDVKCLAWHPFKGILASGSKDNLAKIWDPKTGKALATLHGHKNTIMQCEWNKNGNWLLTCCRDQLVRLYDIRTMKEMQIFRGHKREVQSISWHPIHSNLFSSGGWEGGLMFWLVGQNDPVVSIEQAHESSIFSLDWHPLGHLLASGSNDHTTKFWTRNRPGDLMNDKINLTKEEADSLGLMVENITPNEVKEEQEGLPGLPGLDSNRIPRYSKKDKEESSGGWNSLPGHRNNSQSGQQNNYQNQFQNQNQRHGFNQRH
ncbi:hypothetical protein HDV01_001317 [Terramyces sp. JEL0728]|nr:hypothetical protein HDV01_001317 [Terramyces sp. JEL0728]